MERLESVDVCQKHTVMELVGQSVAKFGMQSLGENFTASDLDDALLALSENRRCQEEQDRDDD